MKKHEISLRKAIQDSNILLLKALVNHIQKETVSLEKKNGLGETPLTINAFLGYFDRVKELVRAGAKINVQNKYGETALMKVCSFSRNPQRLRMARYLIKHGASCKIATKRGRTVIDNALLMTDVQMMKVLLNSGARIKNIRRVIKNLKGSLILRKIKAMSLDEYKKRRAMIAVLNRHA